MERPSYLMWLIEEDGVILDNGKAIKCYKLDYSDDEKTLDAWAVHIRRHYISDADLEESCNEIIKQLMYLEQTDNTKEITIYINSPGGSVNSGLAVYDLIRIMKSPVRTVCTGCAASMGSILFLAGDKREMLPHTQIMMHDPSYGGGNLAGVKPMQIKEILENILRVRDTIANIIAERTGLSLGEVYKITEKDSFFTAEKALQNGIATAIISDISSADI